MPLSSGTHGVVIVHGIGDQRAGDTLAEFSKGLCDTLINSTVDSVQGPICPDIELKSDARGSPPSVTLQITSPDGKEQATWLCQEAFWNDAFPAPAPTQVLWWGVNQNLLEQLRSLFRMLGDPANENGNGIKLGKTSKVPVVARSGFVSGLALIVFVPVVYVVLGLIWLLHFVPSIGPLDKVISWVRKLDPFISSSLGDIERYIDHEIWSANARAKVENVVIGMLGSEKVKDITIVAHSMGAVVAYDALTEGGNIAQAVTRMAEADRKKITLVTVGGAINRVFSMIPPPGPLRPKPNREIRFNDQQITKPLAKVITGFTGQQSANLQSNFYWLDIYARRDPVPAGPVGERIITGAEIDPVAQMKERKVVNKDSMLFDHVSYWQNRELVMPRIMRAINGGTDYPWPEAGITRAGVLRRIRTAARYASLSEIVLFLAAIGLIVFACLKLTGTI